MEEQVICLDTNYLIKGLTAPRVRPEWRLLKSHNCARQRFASGDIRDGCEQDCSR
jgi:hypothetical protein